ncbi:hypothetical protein FVEN_g59 [Fusarium venenatum]|uniref:Secreted protein n=2 Tax=Fusarium venenatum TaxID=56646 RepID=A0A2L2TR85_9HYPO|nr:uncharacterized protein FVRRES_07856 [Fusarium venenatum]KAG8362137.1 hypothetical protein FVEN_g59 [Fusarium venenatum]CEI63420.1 unnamed protein product [Fusarium venenatum]
MLNLASIVALTCVLQQVQSVPVTGSTSLSTRDVIPMLPPKGDAEEEKYQPLLDFDTDSCYYTSAIDIGGRTNPGLEPYWGNSLSKCRESSRIHSSHVYSRQRCNNGWCAIMYEYYFEMDHTGFEAFGAGHKHDRENIVIFVKDSQVKRVAPSCHGKYDKASENFLTGGDRAKLVFHKDGLGTHCFRIATKKDDDKVENFTKDWILGSVLGWNHWPSGELKYKMFEAWRSGVAPKLWDWEDAFTKNLRMAAGDKVPGFDPSRDE